MVQLLVLLKVWINFCVGVLKLISKVSLAMVRRSVV